MRSKHLSFVIATLLAATAAHAAESEQSANGDRDTQTLSTIKVQEDAIGDGSAVDGYRSSSARQVGPLGEVELQEVPLSIAIISSELIENLQATKADDLFRLQPGVQLKNPQSRFFTSINVRGFDLTSTKRIDNIPSTSTYVNTDVEDKESVEIVNGLAGFLYGTGNVGGTVNYVLKRPTAERVIKLIGGVNDGSSLYGHGDFGGSFADGKFGYRLNVVGQDGDTSVDYSSIYRELFSGAFDWHIIDSAVLQLDASNSRYKMEGTAPYWATSGGVRYPDAPDADTYYGQPYSYTKSHQQHVGARFQWDINDAVRVRSGFARREIEMELIAANNTLVSGGNVGDYIVQTSAWEYPDITDNGGYLFADVKFNTGAIEHGVVVGYYGDSDERTNFRSSTGGWATLTSEAINLSNPVYFDTLPGGIGGAKYITQKSRFHNFVAGDDIHFNDAWSAMIGLNRNRIIDRSFGATGAKTANYDDHDITPTASLSYKPVTNVTLYTSYMESLEKGGVASQTYNNVTVVNAGEVMAPLTSEQIELGAKATLGGTLLTAALFQIDKGLQYYDVTDPTAPVYVQDGRQVHRGIELSAIGRVTPQLTLITGVTLLDAKVKENHQTPAVEGKTPSNVAEKVAKIYAEYDIAAVPGLTLSGGVYYTGEQQVDTTNTYTLPSFTTADIGARYLFEIGDVPLTIRANVNNVTNESYWLTTTYTGDPRTYSASVQVDF